MRTESRRFLASRAAGTGCDSSKSFRLVPSSFLSNSLGNGKGVRRLFSGRSSCGARCQWSDLGTGRGWDRTGRTGKKRRFLLFRGRRPREIQVFGPIHVRHGSRTRPDVASGRYPLIAAPPVSCGPPTRLRPGRKRRSCWVQVLVLVVEFPLGRFRRSLGPQAPPSRSSPDPWVPRSWVR